MLLTLIDGEKNVPSEDNSSCAVMGDKAPACGSLF